MLSKAAPAGCSIEEMIQACFELLRNDEPERLVSAERIRLHLAICGYYYSSKQVRDALFRLREPENIYHHYLNRYGYGRWAGLHDNQGLRVLPVSVE